MSTTTSASSLPISPLAFASALKDLPLTTLHLKAAELRNSIAHLDYSNEQLKPFALGHEPPNSAPDPDCVEAIAENEVVIARMQERIGLLRAEVEGRGSSWLEFMTSEELEADKMNGLEGGETGEEGEGEEDRGERMVNGEGRMVNGTAGHDGEEGERRSNPWTDGTFQTGRIVNGEVRMDNGASTTASGPQTNGVTTAAATTNNGGTLDDEALRRAMEERMRSLAAEDDGGMHL